MSNPNFESIRHDVTFPLYVAAGLAQPWSDIDVAVVSPDFSEDLFEERLTLMQWAAAIDDRIEPQPFTPDRFGPNNPLASEIARRGVRLI